jgi:calcineurin-like phosphoesterase family protein
MANYLVADTHWGHSNIIKHCHRLQFMTDAERAVMESGDSNAISQLRISWESTTRMDKALLDGINSMVGENDQLFHLGDFCWVRGNAEKIASVYTKYRNQIKCRKVYLIYGNHDAKQFSKGREAIENQCIFTDTFDLMQVNLNNELATLSHYAMLRWDRSHYRSFCFFAHSHGKLSGWLDEHIPGYNGLDVGVDSAYQLLGEYRPFSFEEAKKIILSKQLSH